MTPPAPLRPLSGHGSSSLPRKPRRAGLAGFTIIEVAMAATVMALGISSAILVMQRSFGSLDTARCLGYASQIMQSEMEKMRLTAWGDGTTAGTGTTGITAIPATAQPISIDAAFFNNSDIGSRMTLTQRAADVHAGMIQLIFTITWRSYDGRTLSRTYTTSYGQKGLYDYIAL